MKIGKEVIVVEKKNGNTMKIPVTH